MSVSYYNVRIEVERHLKVRRVSDGAELMDADAVEYLVQNLLGQEDPVKIQIARDNLSVREVEWETNGPSTEEVDYLIMQCPGPLADLLQAAHYDTNWEGYSVKELRGVAALVKDFALALDTVTE